MKSNADGTFEKIARNQGSAIAHKIKMPALVPSRTRRNRWRSARANKANPATAAPGTINAIGPLVRNPNDMLTQAAACHARARFHFDCTRVDSSKLRQARQKK